MTSRRLLVIDSSYSLEAIRDKKLETSVTCRDLDGYFDRVWTVHPFATLVTSESWSSRHGPPESTELAPRHVFIEGKMGRFEALDRVRPMNFLAAQSDILARLIQLVRQNDISVVRAGHPSLMGVYGLAVARACGIPLVVRVGGNYERARQESGQPVMKRFFRTVRVERAVERFVLSRTDLVAAANEDYRRYTIDFGADPDKTTIFRYGNLVDRGHLVDPKSRAEGWSLLAPYGITPDGVPFLLCVGRLHAIKMPDHAVRTLAKVREAGLRAKLVMVGGGELEDDLRKLAGELGVGDDVVFTRDQNQEWLARVIPLAAVVLSPLTGRALVEVGFGGAPTVAYDIDWHGELVKDGVNGALVPLGAVDAMGEATVRYLRDRRLAERMGNALRESTLDMMHPDRLDEHEREQYDLLFARFGKPGLARS